MRWRSLGGARTGWDQARGHRLRPAHGPCGLSFTGIQRWAWQAVAANLAWKLAGRVNGWAGEALLTSYDLERRPVFKQVGEEFITARIKWEGEVINRHDPKQNPTAFAQDWAEIKTGAGPVVANF